LATPHPGEFALRIRLARAVQTHSVDETSGHGQAATPLETGHRDTETQRFSSVSVTWISLCLCVSVACEAENPCELPTVARVGHTLRARATR